MYISSDIASRIKELCKNKNIIIKDMLVCCGLSKNALSSMLSGGSTPKSENLARIADYLDCSVDYLLGRTDNPDSHKITAHRTQSEIQMAVDRMLDIEMEGYVRLYTAAQSTDNHPEEIIYMRKDRWEQMQQAPETDENFGG
ncbi:MAG: helix-turn-helix transcriptional regulator [Ruminococcaceae bacterium]|nr:helix-turn-helix transcriptional regulator [Oscillospiraceae bacterium]